MKILCNLNVYKNSLDIYILTIIKLFMSKIIVDCCFFCEVLKMKIYCVVWSNNFIVYCISVVL